MNKRNIKWFNMFLFILEIYKDIGNYLSSILILFSMEKTLLYDINMLINTPLLLIGYKIEAFASFIICIIFCLERKYLIERFRLLGVSEKFCKAIKIFSVISVITTLEYFLTIVILGNQ